MPAEPASRRAARAQHPRLGDEPLPGVQHKYPETVLIFPKQGQTCHAYCTYCFRWAQFVDEPDLKMATDDMARVIDYLRQHHEVTSVLITGGDPMIMGAAVLRRYVEPLLDPGSSTSSRSGSAPSRWPTGRSGSSPTRTPTTRCGSSSRSWRRAGAWPSWRTSPTRGSSSRRWWPRRCAGSGRPGAVIRTQAPLIRSINDDPATWAGMWRTQMRHGHGAVLHVRGARHRPAGILRGAAGRAATRSSATPTGSVSGLCRTVRGPSMSATPGKVCVDGIAEVAGEKVFVLHMIQARDPTWSASRSSRGTTRTRSGCPTCEPAFAARFPFEPDPEELPGLWAPAGVRSRRADRCSSPPWGGPRRFPQAGVPGWAQARSACRFAPRQAAGPGVLPAGRAAP